jgi:hypothetical protein
MVPVICTKKKEVAGTNIRNYWLSKQGFSVESTDGGSLPAVINHHDWTGMTSRRWMNMFLYWVLNLTTSKIIKTIFYLVIRNRCPPRMTHFIPPQMNRFKFCLFSRSRRKMVRCLFYFCTTKWSNSKPGTTCWKTTSCRITPAKLPTCA